MISPSVITTATQLPLPYLFQEVRKYSEDVLFDLFLVRDIDVDDCFGARFNPQDSLAEIIASDDFVDKYVKWVRGIVLNQPGTKHPWFSALATYLPAISSCVKKWVPPQRDMQKLSVAAIVNAVRCACELHRRGWLKSPVVEIVCGTVLDFCHCSECKAFAESVKRKRSIPEQETVDCFLIGHRTQKLDVLFDALLEVCHQLRDESSDWALALEIEPGPTYLINDNESIRQVHKRLTDANTPECIKKHVGFNVDIAHAKAASIGIGTINDIKHSIVHAHICDNPGMHTRDLPVGEWNPLTDADGDAHRILEILFQEAKGIQDARNGLPSARRVILSESVSLELEGCGRLQWIHEGLSGLRFMLSQFNRRREYC